MNDQPFIGRQSFSDARAPEGFEAHPTMTESSDLKASSRTILCAYALVIPSALASWWLWPASPQSPLPIIQTGR